MRLISLNSWKCDGAYARRLSLMGSGLAGLAPDLVALQEVFIAPALGGNTARFLAAALEMQAAVLPLRRKERRLADIGQGVDSWSGLAILSRWPILSQRAIPLPSDPRDGERAALAVEIDCAGRRIWVIALHLTHLTDGEALRREQWEHVVAAAADFPTVLVAGDFNASADLFGVEERFIDCRRHLGQGPRSTLIGGGPGDCIDHILFSRDGELTPVRCQEAMTDAAQAASDHCAVVADFVLEGSGLAGDPGVNDCLEAASKWPALR